MARLKDKYLNEIRPALMKELGYRNVMQAPRIEKIILNTGLGDAIQNANVPDSAVRDMSVMAGQKPVVTKAKKSVSNFKLRAGMRIGCMVTLRGTRMYEFLDRLFSVAIPRVRDFRGLSPDSFDGRGNYSVGFEEQLIFPEIDYTTIDRVRGFQVVIVTSAQADREARTLLEMLGAPFRREAA